jgi:hypothetical protein
LLLSASVKWTFLRTTLEEAKNKVGTKPVFWDLLFVICFLSFGIFLKKGVFPLVEEEKDFYFW